ncbi:hypothetical protein SAMN05444166_0232 [Singulisphaera sp. GP187]|uniref:hypothetical protein n=1 Tax=Singulisphaera sp. GP187 TaxID=1882752 RepID=UPI00092B9019|nr:hypothetical protein [Singulisphaera sp. GP187]SIN70076.1 hypothetical protein SAMN05444166_0232 [Singulisphaera sp. GP187]
MSDTTLRLRHPTGANLYAQIEGGGGVWNGTAYVAFVNADWATYATLVTETPAGSGRYVCQFPTASPPGNYSWSIYLRAGGSAALGDVAIGQGDGYWDGTTFGGTSKVTDGITVADLPSPAPNGYGPIGTGSVTVNQDYPTAGNLSYQTVGGQGIGGALVRAYLASEYASNPNAATIRGQTLTLDTGAWANNIDLDPEDYKITFKADGYELLVIDLSVS